LVEEKLCFAKLVNEFLKGETDLADVVLPLNPESDDLFHSMESGVVLAKLINIAVENTIDFRAMNNKKNLNVYQVKENLNLAINACKGIGLKLPGINTQAFIEKKHHLILAVLWQVMRLCLVKKISLKDCPEIMRLAEEGEQLQDLMKLAAEAILIRWINFHLRKQGVDKKVGNLGGDLKDSVALLHVLNSLDAAKCNSGAGLAEADLVKRAEIMIRHAESIGVPQLVRPSDITSGNSKLLTIFVAELFNAKHGLEELNEEEKEAYEKAGIDDDDVEGSRDERAFRFWINSLALEDVYINDLIEDVKTGVVVLKVLDKLKPGAVEWKKIDKNPNNTFKKGINCGQVIEISKKLGLKIPGIGGSDFVDGNKKNIIAVVWQLVRLNYL
jgi:plastin-1